MLSGQIGKYKYYKIEDMYNSSGCRMCAARTQWQNNIFLKEQRALQEECSYCPIFYAVTLTKLYAKKLADYDWRYADDGK